MATWLKDIVTALERLGGSAQYDELYQEVANVRGGNLPATWKAIIRRTIETNSSDSQAFAGRDIFFSVGEIGDGRWGLRDGANEQFMEDPEQRAWYENDSESDESYQFKEYEVTSTPNDFNTKTIIDFIESGLFKIPGFQRNYVWDIKRASKLIESIIIGLPIPQVFLYELGKNEFLVVDGQQRLLTLYFFYKGRFPKKSKRLELRHEFGRHGKFADDLLADDDYFDDFELKLNDPSIEHQNKLHGLTYLSLEDYKTQFDLRTVRNIMIKQNFPTDDDSAMYEIFNRLNSGGVILKPQEIRTSMFHSPFYDMLYQLNVDERWRNLLNKETADLHMKDVEILLRGFGLLMWGGDYKPSMTRFLNEVSRKSRDFEDDDLTYFQQLFERFCENVEGVASSAFLTKSGKFSITVFESIFVALCERALLARTLDVLSTTADKIEILKENPEFISATQDNTAGKQNVDKRLELARQILV